jgi:hypothetical protein
MKSLRLLVAAIIVIGFTIIALLIPSSKAYADIAPFYPCPNGSYSRVCNDGSSNPASQCSVLANCLTTSRLPAWQLYLINLGIESAVATVFVLLLRKSKRLIWAVVIVNLISWPILYTSVSHFQTTAFLLLAEVAVWVFEAAGIYLICSWRTTPKQALLLSTLTNASTIAASFLLVH